MGARSWMLEIFVRGRRCISENSKNLSPTKFKRSTVQDKVVCYNAMVKVVQCAGYVLHRALVKLSTSFVPFHAQELQALSSAKNVFCWW